MSLEESLRIEQANDVPTEALNSVTSKLRRRFFEGDALSAASTVKEYGCSNGLISITLKELRALGYTFDEDHASAENGQTITFYTMINPTHWPDKALFDRVTRVRTAKAQASQRKRRAKVKVLGRASEDSIEHQINVAIEAHPAKQRRTRGKPPLPVLPQLGSDLRVVMVRIDEESGAAYIGLKNGTVSWEVLVEAQN